MVADQPSATGRALELRGKVLAQVRRFFAQRAVLEVETPLLCTTTATDPHLDSIRVEDVLDSNGPPHFLQTSPEFAMKKLLAGNSGPIFQICKAFRRGERSSRHNPEFTMLEWYRPDFDEHQLMDEVAELVGIVTGRPEPRRMSYRVLFEDRLGIDPHSSTIEALKRCALEHVEFDPSAFSREDYFHLLLAEVIEPSMTEDCFVYDFPQTLAALARVEPDPTGVPVARRFELFMAGMEIANGYYELTDAAEQRRRFEADIETRRALRREAVPVDEELIAALEAGLPECAGVALGLDRLLMIVAGADHIDEVINGVTRPEG